MAPSWLVSICAASLIGAIAWRGPELPVALAVAFPAIIFEQATRTHAASVAMSYYLAASAPLLSVWKAFMPDHPESGIVIWLSAAILMTLPWALLWHPIRQVWRCPAALTISVLPPLGVIGWASPLTSAGLLFPGTGFIGMTATVFAPAICRLYPKLLVTAILLTNFLYLPVNQPMDIQALNTHHSENVFQHEEDSRKAIHLAASPLVVLPEGAVRRWTEATEAFWASTIEQLRVQQRSALIGAGIPIPNSQQYRNAAITLGEGARQFDQRIPIPIGMWKPFGPADGVPLNLFGPGTLRVGPHRMAILICYERLLVWPMIQSALDNPTPIVGISNASWTKHTHIPAAQEACLKAWSRLFGIPYVSASNQ